MKKLLLLITALFILASVEGQILRYNNYTAPTPPSGNDLLTNLVAYWDLDETSGTYVDSHGSNDATDHGELWGSGSNGKLGNAPTFTAGTTDYISITEVADLQMYQSDVSVSFWVYVNSIPTDGNHRAFIGSEDTGFEIEQIGYNNGYVRVRATATAPDGPTIGTGAWHHVVVTYSDASATDNIVYYLDGSATTVSGDINVASGKGTIYIGANNAWDNAKTSLDGLMDEVAIWKGRVLDSDDVAALYNDGDGLAYSNFD